ncbi:MAG: DNA-3-methyladenine glycosylase I [Persicimonas sp.]
MDDLPTFDELWERAVERKGEEALEERMPRPASAEQIRATPDDRYLAAMARAAFSSGFKYWIVDAMWDGFETVFEGFDPTYVAGLEHDDVMRLGEDERIVRNKIKIWATIQNARYVCEVADEYGSFGEFVAGWPLEETVELWEHLAEGGHHLGGNSGARALRYAGRDTFILTRDVEWALSELFGVMTYGAKSKSGRRQAQDAFLAWRAECGRPLSQISMVLACAHRTPESY